MVKKIYILILGIFFIIIFISLSDSWSDDGTAVQNVSDCGTLNTTNAVYTLNTSVKSSGTCFNIFADNITLDCQNYIVNYSTESGGYGIYSNASNLTIKNCDINEGNNTGGLYHYGIYIDGLDGWTIENNIIITHKNSAYGIYMLSSSKNTLINNTIFTHGSGSTGIVLRESSSENFFSEMSVYTYESNAYAFMLYNQELNFTIENSTLNSDELQEIYLRGGSAGVTGGEFNFTNVTDLSGDTISIAWGSSVNGTLNMHYLLNVNIANTTDELESANITLFDSSSYKFSEPTNENGTISTKVLREYKNVNNTKTYYTPHTINVTLANYTTNQTIINLTSTLNYVFYAILVSNSTIPSLTINSPSNGENFLSTAIPINITASDTSPISYCYFNITKDGVIDVSNTQISDCSYTTTTVSSSEADYVVNVFVNDTDNNINISNNSFSTSAGGSGSPPPGGSTGGITVVSKETGEALWSMTTRDGAGKYQLNPSLGIPKTKSLLFKNLGDESRIITLSCEDGEICEYLEFEETTFTLPLAKEVETIKDFTITLPEDLEKKEYILNIKATDDKKNEGILTVELNLDKLTFLSEIANRLTANFYTPLIFVFSLLVIGIGSYFIGLNKLPVGALWSMFLALGLSIFIIFII